MSFSLFKKSRSRQNRPRRSPVVRLLVDRLPRFFDRVLAPLGFNHLWWLILLLVLLSIPLITTPLTVRQQGVVAIALILVGQVVVRTEAKQSDKTVNEYFHLFLVWLSPVTTMRYLYYRFAYTLNFDTWVNGFFCVLLLVAELYAVLTLVLAYFQTLKIKDRETVDLANYPQDQWFSVDVYIPTYNEPVDIVRKTALAALAMDYPEDKKQVYVLDDGRKYPERRKKLKQMCEEIGCKMLIRPNNDHAKAGNINTAFNTTKGDLVLILDCDHIPVREFLMRTVGFFYNPKVSFVQTPHWFYNPDPFERNLQTKGEIPVMNELFYKVLQKGNDFWNACFFCGSAAVIRKTHALEIGGIAVETVTEDCHTAFRLHSLGYESVYYDQIMIAGLAPETFASYVGQQVRWARGMAQILRLEFPLLNWKAKHLTLGQRICYFSATSHFFYGFPRLIYAITPTLFLLFSINPIQGLGIETLFYAFPHLLISLNANYVTYKQVRFSFWNEVFEFVMSFQTGYVTLMAVINPKLGSFNVTDKGVSVSKRSFDWQSVQGLLVVTALVIAALLAVPFWLLLRPEDTEAVLVNAMWCVFNSVLLIAGLLVAFEQPQQRPKHRLPRRLPVTVHTTDQSWPAETVNISESGVLIALDSWPNLPDQVDVEIVGDYGRRAFVPGQIIRKTPISDHQVHLAINFINPTQAQLDDLVLVIYSDVREWYSQKRAIADRPMGSLGFLATGMFRSFRELNTQSSTKVRKQIRATAQLYWEGKFYSGRATEMGVMSLRVELDRSTAYSDTTEQTSPLLTPEDLRRMEHDEPFVGLLLSQESTNQLPQRLLAQIVDVEDLSDQVAIELKFPDQLRQKQESKIKQLLKVL